MIFGLTGNDQKPEFFSIVTALADYLQNSGHDLILSANILQISKPDPCGGIARQGIEDMARNSDVILSIGGDGTILSTVRQIGHLGVPVLGIRIGRLGFLAEGTLGNYLSAVQDIINGNYIISERTLLEAALNRKIPRRFLALNEIVIEHGSARILKTHINVSGEFLNTYESDGVIFSTPTGSTAYSLSAGGPIVTPALDVILVTPVCPHSLSARPIVLSGTETIQVSFDEDQLGMALAADGQVSVPLDYAETITIRKADYTVKMIGLRDTNFFQTLRTKLGWSGKVR